MEGMWKFRQRAQDGRGMWEPRSNCDMLKCLEKPSWMKGQLNCLQD
jgi:hypothetical protein